MNGYDFGYAWPWTYGHLLLAVVLVLAAGLGRARLPVWGTAVLLTASAWAMAGFFIVHFLFYFNAPQPMPTQRFLTRGQGRVLDIGCGSGRTTIMIGLARPQTELFALDNFSAEYIRNNGEDRLRRNLRVAGIDSRVRVVKADMRRIPVSDGEFDGVVSSYAIDHLNRKGIEQALGEVRRVLKPGGEFLLSVIRADAWLKFVYGPLLLHQRRVAFDFWPRMLANAGLTLVEEGRLPGSSYYVCRKP